MAKEYLEVVADFRPSDGRPPNGAQQNVYRGTWFRAQATEGADKETRQKAMRLPTDGEEAKQIIDRARAGVTAIDSIQSDTPRSAPPLFYDLTELQRHANRLYGFSAQKTLDVAQALYESYKLISYPRTASRHLSQDVVSTLPEIVKNIEAPYCQHLSPGTGDRPLGRRFIDDSKVTDHHAIIPTAISAGKARLSDDERKIYGLICRRLLSAWQDEHIWSVTTVITAITNGAIIDRYHASGTVVQQAGWKALDIVVEKTKSKRGQGSREEERVEQVLPPGLAKGQPQDVIDVKALTKKTRAPKRLTDGTMLTAMDPAPMPQPGRNSPAIQPRRMKFQYPP